jgi:dUTP pyrophosphatase
MLFEATSSTAKIPVRGSIFSAGYDFFASEDFIIPARGRCLVKTDIKSNFNPGIVLFMKSRSGLAVKNGIYTEAGVIDADYRGLIGVALNNTSDEMYEGHIGDRISQGVFLKLAEECYPLEIDLDVRDGGFGSTGK